VVVVHDHFYGGEGDSKLLPARLEQKATVSYTIPFTASSWQESGVRLAPHLLKFLGMTSAKILPDFHPHQPLFIEEAIVKQTTFTPFYSRMSSSIENLPYATT